MSRVAALLGILALLVLAGAAPSLAYERNLDQVETQGASPTPAASTPATTAAPSPATSAVPPAGAAAAPIASATPTPAAAPPATPAPVPSATPNPTPRPTPRVSYGPWHRERKITFYGPGLYGRRTACGLALTTKLVGVATYLYPCGTKIQFTYRGRTIVAPVVDRGPSRQGPFRFDLTGRACVNLVGSKGACWTIHNVQWRVLKTR